MGMVVNHNISAINTRRNLNMSNKSMNKSLQKLSSGYRINVGADGPADLIISEQLRAQTVGLERAVRNTMEASNVIGIAEGALNEMNNILKTMRSLALHAANNGITSPQQVAADQSEVDSSIQTIDRIAATTKYSDQFLLNGSKGILFDRETESGNTLLDLSGTRIDQVFKRKGTIETLSFAGSVNTDDAANMAVQASKGYMEAGATSASRSEIDMDTNEIKNDQRFIVTGTKGSRAFSFSEGTSLSAIADGINNVSGSTGVEATTVMLGRGLTQRTASVDNGTGVSGTGATDITADADIVNAGQTIVFNESVSDAGDRIDGVTWEDDPIIGKGTDGHGRIFVEWSGTATNATVKLYKGDKDPLTNQYDPDDLVAEGTGNLTGATTFAFSERNDSGVNGQFEVVMPGGPSLPSDVVMVTQTMDRTESARASRLDLGGEGDWQLSVVADTAGAAGNNISVELIDPGVKGATTQAALEQVDPDDTAKGYKITVSLATDANTGEITATDADVVGAINGVAGTLVTASTTTAGVVLDARAETFLSGGLDAETGFEVEGNLKEVNTIAINGAELGVNTDAEGKLYFEVVDADADGLPTEINVYKNSNKNADSLVAKWQGAEPTAADSTFILEEENDSGIRIALQVAAGDLAAGGALSNGDSTVTFETGVRLSSADYGASEFVRVEALEGNMWDMYDANDVDADSRGYVNLDTSEGFITMESRGSGATLAVNGQEIFTDGLTAEAATQDFNGHLEFREGEVGETTIAQVGYNKAYSSTAIGQMSLATNIAVNGGIDSRESLSNFSNGMQFQLGEGGGDQERTVYGIQSMAVANLGKVSYTEDFEGNGVESTKTLTMSDMLGGGFASLAVDPVKALEIIDKAIEDVSSLRARLGAFQKNMLQTNANSLNVAIENITATESSIRDADMAYETAEFTKNQILVQAGTAMLAQANATSQNVLQLLG